MLRNYLYDKQIIKSTKFAHPVISVGNLSLGGTGKTPHIEYLIELLQPHFRIATLSRGYGRKSTGLKYADNASNASSIGDEPMMYHRKYPQIDVIVSENRLIAIPDILSTIQNNQVILLDDAYQHRSVKPGLSILLTALDEPFYKDHIIPLGMLREPRKEYKRADIIIVTKCKKELTIEERKNIIREISPYKYQHVYFSKYTYGDIYGMFTREFKPINGLKNTSIILFTGIANDEAIFQYLSDKVKAVYPLKFSDHHYFDRFDIETLQTTYQNIIDNDKIILTTEKDATRIALLKELMEQKNLPIYILPVKVSFSKEDKEQFDNDIMNYMLLTLKKHQKHHSNE